MKKDGEILREIAFKKGYRNASKLAEKMELSRVTVNNDFNDERLTIKTLEKYTRFLGFTFDDFESLRKAESSKSSTNEWREIALNYKNIIDTQNQAITILREELASFKQLQKR